MGKLLEMKNISKSFPGVKALENVNLDLNYGEVLALVGENGAGKSTLMKILTGIYKEDEGEVYYEGSQLKITSPKDAQEQGISIIHQELNLMKDLSVAENIFIGSEPKGFLNFIIKDHDLNLMAEKLFQDLKINIDPKTKVKNLTVAKQQMVEIAKALSFDSKILIMDEPTTALTDTEIDILFTIIEQLKKKGVGIVYISHRMDELKRISDRVLIMRDGKYVDSLQTEKSEISEIINKMVGREIFIESKPSIRDKDTEVVLELKNIKTNTQISNISFELKKGEILGFAGLMGAGRTEVANAIFGVDKIQKGEVFLHGKKVSITSPEKAVKNGIGYLSEDRKQLGLLVELDVKTNITMSNLSAFQQFGIVKVKKSEEISEYYVDKLKIKTPSVNQKLKYLSGGNQQKVVIAKWLLKNCDILIFDEPTRGIDVGAKGEIYRLLDELAEQGKSIIMISSELPEVLRMSHRVVVMSEGKISGILEAEDASQEKIMELATSYHG